MQQLEQSTEQVANGVDPHKLVGHHRAGRRAREVPRLRSSLTGRLCNFSEETIAGPGACVEGCDSPVGFLASLQEEAINSDCLVEDGVEVFSPRLLCDVQ